MSPDGRMRYAPGMRGLLVVLLVGCTWSSDDRNRVDDPFDPAPPGGGHRGCHVDGDCSSGELCARTGSCLPASQIHAVHVNWTVRGMAASEEACGRSPDFE